MNRITYSSTLEAHRDEVSASSAGGAPFLVAFGVSLFLCAALSFVFPLEVAAMVVMFQGSVALPIAVWLERRMGSGPMAADNPLRPLSVQLAMSQIVALPAVFIAYNFHPATVPAAFAAIGGAHFLPYAWLQRSKVYAVLGVAVSVGGFALTVALKREAFPWVLMHMSALYAVAAPLVRANASRLTRRATAQTA